MEDLENARSLAAKGFGDDKQVVVVVVESLETQISPTTRLSQRIAKRLETWGVEPRGAISLFVF